ncbi:hypothetical protein B0T22DRAFT_173718 [Podospora appendiculata]|uniref:F-box domain-containing protein n=1 Tax=Podospora appendiculata TaxID=314037 RepID=A0AAE0XC76_9PEZI|nr:hypothetical protein B0T22DRAFT_173718 [Podospora appendiculata]
MEQQQAHVNEITASDKPTLDNDNETSASEDGLWYDAPAEPLPDVDQDPSNPSDSHGDRKGKSKEIDNHAAPPPPQPCRLVSLPTELINSILSYLCPADLVAVSATCHALRIHAHDDHLWQAFVQASVPGVRVTSAYPCESFRMLFRVHEPRWFLPRHKIWFSDCDLTGRLVIVRYDQRRGCIEGYQLVAVSTRTAFQTWQADNNVIIHTFEPKVMLHLDKPVLQLPAWTPYNPAQQHHRSVLSMILHEPEGSSSSSHGSSEPIHIPPSRFRAEIPMPLGSVDTVRSNFIHARIIAPPSPAELSLLSFPYNNIWPPPTIPTPHRVLGASPRVDRILGSFTTLAPTGSPSPDDNYLLGDDLAPRSRREMSDQTFRIRKWLEVRDIAIPGIEAASVGLHIGEEISTYATLDAALYTPTPEKPYRGIWVGDYSGHGCEFLLIHQPDDDPGETFDADALVQEADETDEAFAQRKADRTVYRGRLEAIKLTGDPNVPRGEFTFVADDLGDDGFLETAQDEPFKGARVVKSRGHIANTGFVDDMYIESRLILVSHDRLAQHWVEFGHMSFFDRVDIDRFIIP